MLARCTNPNRAAWKHYGGRGITVCDRWRHGEDGRSGFECFLSDMGPRPQGKTLDRHPNKAGNYEPGNCRWATWIQQQNNRTDNVLITAVGRTQTRAEWCREIGWPSNKFDAAIRSYTRRLIRQSLRDRQAASSRP